MAKFQKDVESEAVADAVSRDRKQGERLDIQSTPTLYINGRQVDKSVPDPKDDLVWKHVHKLDVAPFPLGLNQFAPTKCEAGCNFAAPPLVLLGTKRFELHRMEEGAEE